MNIVISNSFETPLYKQIQNQIKSQILSGELDKDQMIPFIRSLAKVLRGSIITTKRAYEELEKEGKSVRVVSVPCMDVFEAQSPEYIEEEYRKIKGSCSL